MKHTSVKQSLAALLMASAAQLSAAAVIGSRADGDCAPVHLLVARGSTEAPGFGQLNSLATKIVQGNSGATKEAIDYPAKLQPYGPSVSAGVTAVKNQLSAYVQKCPDSKIVLLGYSQGANIIGDALCGGNTGGSGPDTTPLDADISKHVVAIVWYGDPRFVVGKPFDKGTSQRNGINARTAAQNCDSFGDLIASYCDTNDPFCASGNNVQVHLTYPYRYDTAAATFVGQKVGGN